MKRVSQLKTETYDTGSAPMILCNFIPLNPPPPSSPFSPGVSPMCFPCLIPWSSCYSCLHQKQPFMPMKLDKVKIASAQRSCHLPCLCPPKSLTLMTVPRRADTTAAPSLRCAPPSWAHLLPPPKPSSQPRPLLRAQLAKEITL